MRGEERGAALMGFEVTREEFDRIVIGLQRRVPRLWLCTAVPGFMCPMPNDSSQELSSRPCKARAVAPGTIEHEVGTTIGAEGFITVDKLKPGSVYVTTPSIKFKFGPIKPK